MPAASLHLSNGISIPAGTIVGMNAWAVHRDPRIFGADADSFNPSRWLRNPESETAEQYEERLSAMKRADVTFRSRSRTCLGKNISFLEIYKVIPTLFLKFDICLVDPTVGYECVPETQELEAANCSRLSYMPVHSKYLKGVIFSAGVT